ncbi:Permease of the drug/metabolite transporter (DMT) superfamily [Desulfocicer vacuolatum DSM 3385]|uniref:Permease of the drug/metabolite transporter (DMT) superfamily n=1 Tax=Desulfocicer vacuolatum DSM 3385 TaxID=1121400 RepID=A0A1W2EFS7_9BACT|nr:DMT family transporter [Desulfocicer vacuolatum]SMD08292.1 Permease of the drug/metabolite transporter (DMT) superfamily [Desulfocicer vacuolatum DSM 3385]
MTRVSHFIPAPLKKNLPVAALIAAVLLWGTSFSTMRTALMVLDTWSLIWLRMVIGLICILPLLPKISTRAYQRGDWKILVPTVMLQPCLYFFLESRALMLTTSSQVGIISSFNPLMVTFGAWLFLSERITWQNWAGLFLSMSGVVVLTLFEGSQNNAVNPVLGNFLELCAMTAAAANMILIKQLSSRYNPWTLTAMQLMAGTLFFLPGIKFIVQAPGDIWTFKLIMTLLFLGSCVSLAAFGFYNWGMSKVNASRAASFINLIPVTAIIMGWLLLGESLNPIQCAAVVVVIAGVILGQNKAKKHGHTGKMAVGPRAL